MSRSSLTRRRSSGVASVTISAGASSATEA